MKAIVTSTITSAVIFFSQFAMGAQVVEARLNLENQTIELDVVYSGGCEEHNFELEVRSCARTSPMSCVAQLIDTTKTDTCRGIVEETIEVPAHTYLEKLPLTTLIILGSEDTAVHLPLVR